MAIPILRVHEHGFPPLGVFHWNHYHMVILIDFTFLDLFQIAGEILAFVIIRHELFHVSLGLFPAHFFDHMANFKGVSRRKYVIMVAQPHLGDFVAFPSPCISRHEQYDGISDHLPFVLVILPLKTIDFDNERTSASSHHIRTHFQILICFELICKVYPINRYSHKIEWKSLCSRTTTIARLDTLDVLLIPDHILVTAVSNQSIHFLDHLAESDSPLVCSEVSFSESWT